MFGNRIDGLRSPRSRRTSIFGAAGATLALAVMLVGALFAVHPELSHPAAAMTDDYASVPAVAPYQFDAGHQMAHVGAVPGAAAQALTGTPPIVGWIPLDGAPTDVAASLSSGYVYVSTYSDSGNVTVIDGASEVTTLTVSGNPQGFVADSANGFVYVTNLWGTKTSNVTILNGTTVVGSFYVSNFTYEGVFDPQNGFVYFMDYGSAAVSVVSGSSVIATIPVGTYPDGAAFDPSNGFVYVTNSQSSFISVINGTGLVGSIPFNGTGGAGPVFDSANGDVYVDTSADLPIGGGSYAWTQEALVFHGLSLVRTIVLGPGSDTIARGAYDPLDQVVYFPLTQNNSIIALNSTSVVQSIVVGDNPLAVTYDPISGYLYAANYAAGAKGYHAPENITVLNAGVESLNVTATPSPVLIGSTTTLRVGVSGGGTWNYSYTGLPPGCHSLNVQTLNCTPTSLGTFVVRVYVNGSWGYSITNSVALAVVPGLITSFSSSPPTVEVGSLTNQTVVLSVSTAGVGPWTFTFTGLPPGCASSNTTALTCTPASSGSFTVRVYANDSQGFSMTSVTSLDVISRLTASASVSQGITDAGALISFDSRVVGGTGANTFAWEFGDGALSTLQSPDHSYAASGTYTVRLWVNDSAGGRANTTQSVLVDPALTVLLRLSNTTPALGTSIVINATVSGGVGPYTYAYLGLPPGCVSVNQSLIGCLPTQAGVYTLTATVTDGNGVPSNSTVGMNVVFDFTVIAPTQITVNHAFTLSVRPVGGYGTLTYGYAGLPPGCVSADSASLTCTPNRPGMYQISVLVRDQAGNHVSHIVSMNVINPGSASLLRSPFFWAGVAAVGVALVLAALAVRPRGKNRRNSPSDRYSAYRVVSPPAARAENAPSARERVAAPPKSPLSKSGGEDVLSDLI